MTSGHFQDKSGTRTIDASQQHDHETILQRVPQASRSAGEELLQALMPGFCSGALCGFLFYYFWGQILVPGFAIFHPREYILLLLMLYCMLPVLAFWSGWRQHDWRYGALSGLFLVAAGFVSLIVGSLLGGLSSVAYLESILCDSWICDSLIAATFLGALGGLLGRTAIIPES